MSEKQQLAKPVLLVEESLKVVEFTAYDEVKKEEFKYYKYFVKTEHGNIEFILKNKTDSRLLRACGILPQSISTNNDLPF